jgi:HEAT repeat protein
MLAFVALGTIGLAGCGGSSSSNELEQLIDEAVDEEHGQVSRGKVKEIAEYGGEAIDLLMERIDQVPRHLQYCYSYILIEIPAEPARFEACKKLLEHPNSEVRKDAVAGLVLPDSPDEAIELAIGLVNDAESASVRSLACYAVSNMNPPRFIEA